MRLVVTGASGFIGRNVLLRAPRDWQVLALFHAARDFEAFIEEHELSHVRPIRCDLLDPVAVRAAADAAGGRADAVLYLAANGDPARSANEPRHDLQANTTALVNFLEQWSADHLVYVSSGAVYDGLKGDVSPGTPVSPRLPYAISKLASEHYVRFFSEWRRSLGSYINVRFFGAYGPYEAERKITTRWLHAMTGGQREFVIRGDGRNLIDFMYVDDAVDGFLALVRSCGTSLTVDFASGRPTTVNDVVHAMARALGVSITVRHEGQVPEYIEFRSIDSAMRERFAVEPTIGFTEGFARFQRFFTERQHVGR
jgi:nucleoside-diphosphate-sugar epimerase